MELSDHFVELYDRVAGHVHGIVGDLDADTLVTPPAPEANTIAWLIWHLTRIQDDHVADYLGRDQIWIEGDWGPRFGLESDPGNTGYGHGPSDVAAVRPAGAEALTGYYDAVAARTRGLLETITADDLDQIVDRRWDPPVTLGVRLVSIVDDDIQHAGQAAYVKGLLTRRRAAP